MTIETLSEIRKIIKSAGFFEAVVSSVNDWNEALDERDNERFDKAWVESFNELKSLRYDALDSEKIVGELREFSFKKVFSLTHDSEVAGYISDGICLVADSVSKSNLKPWVAGLFDTYLSGEFPR